MSITTGYNTTQNGQVVDIGTLFSSSPSSYWIGSVIWQLNTNPPTFFQNPAAIVQSNITQTTTNTNGIRFTVPQTGLYIITANLNPSSVTSSYILSAAVPDLTDPFTICYVPLNSVSLNGSAIVPVTENNTDKYIDIICDVPTPTSFGCTNYIQISYLG